MIIVSYTVDLGTSRVLTFETGETIAVEASPSYFGILFENDDSVSRPALTIMNSTLSHTLFKMKNYRIQTRAFSTKKTFPKITVNVRVFIFMY